MERFLDHLPIIIFILSVIAKLGAKKQNISIDEEYNWDNDSPLIMRLTIYLTGFFWISFAWLISSCFSGYSVTLFMVFTAILFLIGVMVLGSYPISMWEWFSTDYDGFWEAIIDFLWAVTPIANIIYSFDYWNPIISFIFYLLKNSEYLTLLTFCIFCTILGSLRHYSKSKLFYLSEVVEFIDETLLQYRRYLNNQLAKKVIYKDPGTEQ